MSEVCEEKVCEGGRCVDECEDEGGVRRGG